MRIILSKGQVNIFNLAKNAGTSVDQIERFYARNLPLSAELALNLQSFGARRYYRKARNRARSHLVVFKLFLGFKSINCGTTYQKVRRVARFAGWTTSIVPSDFGFEFD